MISITQAMAATLAHRDEAADALPTLGLLPPGTANDFATAAGISDEPLAALALIRDGTSRYIDLLKVTAEGEPHWCANVVTDGFGAVTTVEHKDNNKQWTNYLWFGDELVGLVRGTAIYFVHNDHLGRPEIVTNTAEAVVWRASNYAFDRAATQDSIGGLNVGFPGQYYDKESNLWYNINRYYDARLGAYTQSDPIGLAGGANTYAYVGGNPISFVDPLGLEGIGPWTFLPGPQRDAYIAGSKGGRTPDYAKVSFSAYVVNVSFARARNGQIYGAVGLARPYPHPVSAGVSASVGWLNDQCKPTSGKLNRFMTGPGLATNAVYADIGGGITHSPGEGTATEMGVGVGASLAPSALTGSLSGDYGFTIGRPSWGWDW